MSTEAAGGPVPLAGSVVRIRFTGPDAVAAHMLCRESGAVAVLGLHDPSHEDVLVVDEWTAGTDPFVTAARARGVRVTVLAELVLERVGCPVIAVTGTAGKTTTCHMVAHLLRAAGRQPVMSTTARSGNAWPDHSLVGVECGPDHVVVAELTSTHLCHMAGPPGPRVAVVTSIWPDHLEFHGDYDHYVRAKQGILRGQGPHDAVVLPADDPATRKAIGDAHGQLWEFSEGVPVARGAFSIDGQVVLRGARGKVHSCPMPDLHPQARRALLAAATACLALGIDPDGIAPGLARPPGVVHRMAAVGMIEGVRIIDDTMATTPRKALAGVMALGDICPVVIVGGHDSLGGVQVHDSPQEREMLANVLNDVRRLSRAVVAMGSARPRIECQISVEASVEGIEQALVAAVALAPVGGTVIVSPMFPMLPEERMRVAQSAGPWAT